MTKRRILQIALTAVCLTLMSNTQAQVKYWTLKECVDYALENNISIQTSELDVSNSRLDKKGAIGNFLPGASANSSLSWNRGRTVDPITNTNVTLTTMTTNIGGSVGVTLFDGLQNVRQMQRSKLSILASQYQLEDMKDDVSLSIATAFLQILFNKESLRVLESQKAITEQEIERTKELIEAGTVPPGDLFEIEATHASQEQQIVDAENQVRLTRISLAQLLLITDYENFDVNIEEYDLDHEAEVLGQDPRVIFERAIETRYGMKIAEANQELAEKDLEIAQGGYAPTLSAFYSLSSFSSDRDRINLDGSTSPPESVGTQWKDNIGHRYGLQLNIPIFSRFVNNVNVQRSRIQMERAELLTEQTKNDLESAVNQVYSDAKGALKTYHAAEKTVKARSEAFKYAEERHNVGVINSFEYQQTKQLLESAESDLIRAKYDYIFKLKILEFYFGIPITGEN